MNSESIVLAATWNPRGEIGRLERLLEQLYQVYTGICISLPAQPDDMDSQTKLLKRLVGGSIHCHVNPDWSWGRYMALNLALQSDAPWIHYADLDRLLRWVEHRPAEWIQTLAMIRSYDYLVIGRTQEAYDSHPQALVQTEALSNAVISYLVDQKMDVSAGSKGFSRHAAAFVIKHSLPGHALGTDGEWTVILKKAGFNIGYLEVDGLDWESADRYLSQPADPKQQRTAAAVYDADPANWARRTAVAEEIIRSGLQAASRTDRGIEPITVES